MIKAIILIVDDDQTVLNAVERDLKKRYGKDYKVLTANSGQNALTLLDELQKRNEIVALFLVDQRMPNVSGVQFLEKAKEIFPEAKKVLLTAYADTEAAISAINDVNLDYYILKPWDPPEEKLFPVIDDLLADFRAGAHFPFEGLRLAATLFSPEAHEIKEFLVRHQIPYQWLDLSLPETEKLLKGQGEIKIPTVFLPGGEVLVQPKIEELATKVGVSHQASRPFYDMVIIGAGPSGLAAAVYAASEGLKTLVVEKEAPGGQAGTSPKIENYLGFPSGISGNELTARAVAQAKRFGAEVLSPCTVTSIRVEEPYRILKMADGSEVSAHVVLISTGASFRLLEVPGAKELAGAGIYYGAAYTEAMYYQGKEVGVIGGANSAAQGAMFLSRFANRVYMIVRGEELSTSQYLVDLLKKNPKIEILFNTEVSGVFGKGKLESVSVLEKGKKEQKLDITALFVFIGVKPQSEIAGELLLKDNKGFILTGRDLLVNGKKPANWTLERDPYLLETCVPGIFASGDVRSGTNPRVASATGEGAIAVALYWQYIKTLGST